MTSKFLHKQTEIQLLHEIRRNKQLKKNTRTDEQMDQQSQVNKYEPVDLGSEVDIVSRIDHPCITKVLEVYDEEADKPALSNLRLGWEGAKEYVRDKFVWK